jgi:hypothetical protein
VERLGSSNLLNLKVTGFQKREMVVFFGKRVDLRVYCFFLNNNNAKTLKEMKKGSRLEAQVS